MSDPLLEKTLLMDDHCPRISIVTPSYNQAQFLERTILSVLNQKYPNLEYIIMDGGSTDGSVEIIRKYEKYLSYWVSEPDGGQAHAINKGWGRATGEILGWLNSDDLLLPGALLKVAKVFRRRPETALVYGEGLYVDEEEQVIMRFNTERFDRELLEEICFILQPSVFLARKALDRIGMLDESLHYCMDYDLWIRVSKQFDFAHVDEELAASRVHHKSKTMSGWIGAAREDLDLVRRHYGVASPPVVYRYTKAILMAKFRFPLPLMTPLIVLLAFLNFVRLNGKMPLYPLKKWINWAKKMRESNKRGLDIHLLE